MNFSKYTVIGLLAFAFVACTDGPKGVSTKRPVGSGDSGQPEQPGGDATDEVTSPTPNFSLSSMSVSVNPDQTTLEMEGFGASDCWLPSQIGQYWSGSRQQLARWLFSKNISKSGEPEGIGLSMWRVNLGAGSKEQGDESKISANNRAEAYLTSAGVYNWDACVGQQYFMQQAKNCGVEKFILFSNSPLVQFTKNGKAFSESGGDANLKDDCYDDYAEYMAEVAEHFVNEGYNVSHISPVNEPQNNWGADSEGNASQEGSGWSNAQIAKLTRDLDKSLEARGLSTMISIAEAASWEYLYSVSNSSSSRASTINAFFDPSSNVYVGDLKHVGNLICGHSYWTFDNWTDMRSVREKVKKAADAKGLRVWQTEWSMLDKEPSELGGSYDEVSEFDIAQYMSRIIHNDITVAGCTSWSYWTSMSVERWGQKNRFELIKTTPAGGNYSDDFTAEGSVEATDNLWVLGNYSLFVRPGYKLCNIEMNETKDFFGSAYIAPDKSRLVLVFTNYDSEKGVIINMDTPEGTKSVYRYTTTSVKHMKQDRFSLTDKVFVEPKSVTTIVYNF